MMEMFHYCNLSEFKSIVKSKKIWLTPVQSMDDGTEVDYLYNEIWPKVKERIIAETQPQWLKNLQTCLSYIDKSSEFHTSCDMPYCACFSDNGDLLSQWKDHAEDGAGVSIGFDADYFKMQTQPPHPNTNIRNAVGLGTVFYGDCVLFAGLYGLVKKTLLPEVQSPVPWITVLANLTRYSAISKKIKYSSEREKRIIYYFSNQHKKQFSCDFLLGPYKYKVNSYNRFELSWFNSSQSHAITRIILGPNCKQSSAETVTLLNQLDIHIKGNQISESKSSYR